MHQELCAQVVERGPCPRTRSSGAGRRPSLAWQPLEPEGRASHEHRAIDVRRSRIARLNARRRHDSRRTTFSAAARHAARRAEARSDRRGRGAARAHAADRGQRLQLQRDWLSGARDAAVSDGRSRAQRLHRAARRRRHTDVLDRDLGKRQPGRRARRGRRRRADGESNTRRRDARRARARRARARRGPQRGSRGRDHGGDRRKIRDDARAPSGHADRLAGNRRRAARERRRTSCARVCSRASTPCSTRTCDNVLATMWGDSGGSGLVSVEYSFAGRELPCGARSLGRPQRARRRGAHERRLELQTRAPAACTALALRGDPRRRSAERRAAGSVGLVLLPRNGLRAGSRLSGKPAIPLPRARR